MRRSVRYLARAGTLLVLGAVFLTAAVAAAEDGVLELKRLESERNFDARNYMIRTTSPQYFQMNWHARQRDSAPFENPETKEAFKRLVKKEPVYASTCPFRGVAKLGTQEYVFALDRVDPKAEAKEKEAASDAKKPDEAAGKEAPKPSLLQTLADTLAKEPGWGESALPEMAKGYNRLYFDFNHNGDLTDDKVIDVKKDGEHQSRGEQTYVQLEFPRVDLTIDVDGVPMDYSFFLRGYVNASKDYCNLGLQLNAATYREGEITLDGKKRHVYLIDFNSNGRFDDETTIIKVRRRQNRPEEAYPQSGDMLLVDPDANKPNMGSPYEVTSSENRYYVSKLANIDGKFYEMKVSPSGDRLTLTPSAVEVGSITNPNPKFRAVIYGDQGMLKIGGTKDAPIAVPVGNWQLLSYTIDMAEVPEAAKPAAEKPAASSPSLLETLSKTVESLLSPRAMPNRPRDSVVTARALADSKPVKVVKGETVVFPFGPPYTPTVEGQFWGDPSQLNLELSLVGSVGEICSDMRANGDRPSKPHFTIKDPNGEIVQQGDFEYG